MAILNSLNKINDFLDTSSAGKFLGGSKVLPQVGATLFNAAINPNGNSTGIGNTIQSVSSFIPGIGGAIGQVAGGLINTTFGSNINEQFVDYINIVNVKPFDFENIKNKNTPNFIDFRKKKMSQKTRSRLNLIYKKDYIV